MKTKTSFPILVSRIVPVVAALSLFAVGTAQADPAGVAAINNKLATIPGIKAGTTVVTAKSADLLYALTLALEALPSNPNAADKAQFANLVESALQETGGKFRKDSSKIAGQIIATAIANNKIADPDVISAITNAVINVNPSNSKAALTPLGKGVALAGALKASSPTIAPTIGTNLGGAVFTGTAADAGLLLSNTAKALGSSAGNAALTFEAFVTNFLSAEITGATADADRKTQAELAAVAAVKAKAPAAAGSILGGYIGTLGTLNDGALKTAAQGYLANKNLATALGDILAFTMNGYSVNGKDELLTELSTGRKDGALLAQGLLRAGSAGEAAATTAAFLATVPDRVKTAGIVTAGSGNDESKLAAIVTALATGTGIDNLTVRPAIGAAVISSIAALNPEAADAAVSALIDTGGFAALDHAGRNALGAAIAPKVKSFAAVGYMAAGIAEKNILQGAVAQTAAVDTAKALILAKKVKAFTDIAHRIAAISGVDKLAFADSLADAAPKFALNVAVGASLADQTQAGVITKAVINHAPTTDTGTLKKAALIAGKVAEAVDEERAADIAFSVGELVSVKGLGAGKPVKETAFAALATALGKAIQAKPGVTTANRGDELEEVAALLTKGIIDTFGAAPTDAKVAAARDKAIVGVGTAILKLLAKGAKDLSKTVTPIANQTSADGIIGSIALTVRSGIGQSAALLTAGAGLEKALLKLAGAKGSANLANANQALVDVRAGLTAAITGPNAFEDGTLGIADLNDKETDKRNR